MSFEMTSGILSKLLNEIGEAHSEARAENYTMVNVRPGDEVVAGSLIVRVLPFVAQPDYDALLWCCDLNFVRGEDSFVRAQWAGKPLVWHIYPQEDAAHEAKLEAFLDRYTATAESALAGAVRQLFLSWNRGSGVGAAWREFASCREALEAHARTWAGSLASGPDLASSLVKFCTAGL